MVVLPWCNNTLLRIFHMLLQDFWFFILLHWSMTWLQGNTQVLKMFAFSVKSPKCLIFKLLVECNFCQFEF